jgi:hypothetical protein
MEVATVVLRPFAVGYYFVYADKMLSAFNSGAAPSQ